MLTRKLCSSAMQLASYGLPEANSDLACFSFAISKYLTCPTCAVTSSGTSQILMWLSVHIPPPPPRRPVLDTGPRCPFRPK